MALKKSAVLIRSISYCLILPHLLFAEEDKPVAELSAGPSQGLAKKTTVAVKLVADKNPFQWEKDGKIVRGNINTSYFARYNMAELGADALRRVEGQILDELKGNAAGVLIVRDDYVLRKRYQPDFLLRLYGAWVFKDLFKSPFRPPAARGGLVEIPNWAAFSSARTVAGPGLILRFELTPATGKKIVSKGYSFAPLAEGSAVAEPKFNGAIVEPKIIAFVKNLNKLQLD